MRWFACSSPTYFTPKSSTTNAKLIGHHWCFQKPGVTLLCVYPAFFNRLVSCSCASSPAWGSPYMPCVLHNIHIPSCQSCLSICIPRLCHRGIVPSSSWSIRVNPSVSWGNSPWCRWSWILHIVWIWCCWGVVWPSTGWLLVYRNRLDNWSNCLPWLFVFCRGPSSLVVRCSINVRTLCHATCHVVSLFWLRILFFLLSLPIVEFLW